MPFGEEIENAEPQREDVNDYMGAAREVDSHLEVLRLQNECARLIANKVKGSRFVVIVSNRTKSGGIAGVSKIVTRELAAEHIVNGWARLATVEEMKAHLEEEERLTREQRAREAAKNLRISVTTGDAGEPEKTVHVPASKNK